METIQISVNGDYCTNLSEIESALENIDAHENVVLDFQTEAPCIKHIGVEKMIKDWCDQQGRSYSSVFLVKYPNPVADTVFRNMFSGVSHFLWMSENYRNDIIVPDHQYLLGLFIGRCTPDRERALIRADEILGSRLLASCMDPSQLLARQGFSSIDGHVCKDQYDPGQNTNRDILSHYHKFDIELVMETYTRGQTFFPTEKIFRPIMAGRPFLVYGPKFFLKNLRDLGFRTFDHIWNEDYDHHESEQRWGMIESLIEQLSLYDSKDLFALVKPIIEHNHHHLAEMTKKWKPL